MTKNEKYNILIVDDNIDDIKRYCSILRSIDLAIQFNSMNNSIDAIDYLRCNQNEIDLIILDLNMPNLDGIDFLNIMDSEEINVPVIICSQYIQKYSKEIDRFKVIKAYNKNILSGNFSDNIINIFLNLNNLKSCMIVDANINKLIKLENEKNIVVDRLNEIKEKISELSDLYELL